MLFCVKNRLYSWADLRLKTTDPISPLCMCVLFLQTVIVIPLAQTLIAVMAQDIVNVRRERQGLSAMSVCQDICGTMAANVSRTSTQPAASVPCSLLRFSFSTHLSLNFLCLLLLFGLPGNEQLGLLTALKKKNLDWLPFEAQSHLLCCLVSGSTAEFNLRELF